MSAITSPSSVATGGLSRRGVALACAGLVLGLTSLGAIAQPRDERHGHGHPRGDRHDHRGPRPGPHPGTRPVPPPVARPHPRPHPHPQPPRPMYGTGPNRRWYRGDRLPPQYRSRQYVVNDWRRHHLSPPPRGYHWVQYGADYMLVAIATGVIVQLLLSR